jgi:uncharacterized protein (DUF2147 family)
MRSVLLAAAMTLTFVSAAFSAEPIEGTWKRNNGTLIKFANCGGNNFCGTVMTGKYKGKSIGSMAGSGNSYRGKIHVLDEGKTYTGKASVNGNTMKMSGCVLGGLICKGENLARQ